ncbi:replication initiation protein [Staphylococcus aureus]|nr:replication initiation protein [Staphylococcus aureus]
MEIELKRDMVDCWKDCFDDLHILKPNLKMIENIQERAMLHLLTHEEEEWGNLERRTKNKHRDKLKNIASIDLTDLMKISLRGNENQLQKQIDFWLN